MARGQELEGAARTFPPDVRHDLPDERDVVPADHRDPLGRVGGVVAGGGGHEHGPAQAEFRGQGADQACLAAAADDIDQRVLPKGECLRKHGYPREEMGPGGSAGGASEMRRMM